MKTFDWFLDTIRSLLLNKVQKKINFEMMLPFEA